MKRLQNGIYRIYAIEGLDGTGKTTVAKLIVSRNGGSYHHYLADNPFATIMENMRSSETSLDVRFLFGLVCAMNVYKQALQLVEKSDVYLDRTVATTIAYHGALGLSDAMFMLVPTILLDQIDVMIYLTASPETRLARMRNRTGANQPLGIKDQESLRNGEEMDRIYRSLMPDRTITIATDDKRPKAVADEIDKKLREIK